MHRCVYYNAASLHQVHNTFLMTKGNFMSFGWLLQIFQCVGGQNPKLDISCLFKLYMHGVL
jgi:hypothetical protein